MKFWHRRIWLPRISHRRILEAIVVIGLAAGGASPTVAATSATATKPAISPQASEALARMSASLRSPALSFEARTLRVYAGSQNELLHIAHTLDVAVRRPDRMLVVRNGDDGASKLVYDGKTLVIYVANANKYAAIAVPGTIEGMMKEAMGRLGIDFPLADFLTGDPGKAFLSGVTSGRVVGTVTIDGVRCLHMFFSQPPGIDLELWLEENAQSLPRRLIVTYRSLPGQPDFVAEFANWNLAAQPTNADFVFRPPPGAVRIALKPPPKPAATAPAQSRPETKPAETRP